MQIQGHDLLSKSRVDNSSCLIVHGSNQRLRRGRLAPAMMGHNALSTCQRCQNVKCSSLLGSSVLIISLHQFSFTYHVPYRISQYVFLNQYPRPTTTVHVHSFHAKSPSGSRARASQSGNRQSPGESGCVTGDALERINNGIQSI